MTGHITKLCAEQTLEPWETCCLSEVFLPNIESFGELLDLLEFLYRVNKHSLLLPSHHLETEQIVHKNMRMGIGMTGLLQASKEQRGWLAPAYDYLRDLDVRYSEKNNMPRSIKLTTVKPSGTLSLLPGVTAGIHPAYAQYMIRRITIATDHPLTQICKNAGYSVEFKQNFDGTEDYNSSIVSFPYSYPKGTILAKEMTAISQLEEIRKIQKDWSDNSVSCTIYYKEEEIEGIKSYLYKHYKNNFKSLSFLLHQEHGFKQAPYEEITKKKYEELVKRCKPITQIDALDFGEEVEECEKGACPIR